MNILKIFVILAIAFFSVVNANSQESQFSLGVKGGVNLSNVDNENFNTDAKVGYKFSVVAEYGLPQNFFLRSGLDFNSKGFKLDMVLEGDNNKDGLFGDYQTTKSSWNEVYLQLPIVLGYKISVTDEFKINFVAGGYLSYGVGGKITGKVEGFLVTPSGEKGYYNREINENVFADNVLKRFDAGLTGGVGAEYKSITFDLGYEYGLCNIYQGSNSINNRNAFFTVGYKFF